MKKLDWMFIFLVCILLSVFFPSTCRRVEPDMVEKTDTVVREINETIFIDKPKVVTVERLDTIIDTVETTTHDTVEINLPVSLKKYEGDTTTTEGTKVSYIANVSGYRASLDSIRFSVEHHDSVITKEITKYKTRRWVVSPSIGVGYGVITKKPDIFIGVSVGYAIPLGKKHKN